MRNLRLVIAYDGTDFAGWQRQPGRLTVQASIEEAIKKILRVEVSLTGSGRTDAGVHSLNQVANFKTAASIPCSNLLKALNDHLPATIRVKEVAEAPLSFHARHDASAKTYVYRILRTAIASPFASRYAFHYPYPLDPERMAEAARLFEGCHDFTSFASIEPASAEDKASWDESGRPTDRREVKVTPGDSKASLEKGRQRSMLRVIYSSRIRWHARNSILAYKVRGNGFFYHMVRAMAGTLLEVGSGKRAPSEIAAILAARDRSCAGISAPARGLALVRVDY